jgi:hypothetical protein
MSINSSHPIGQYCQWALDSADSLNEQASGVAPTGGSGSVISLPQGDAFVPSTTNAVWATPSALIDPFVNDITIAYYGRIDASFANAVLASFGGSGFGWELKTSFWDGTFVRLDFFRIFNGNGSSVNFGGSGDDNVHHIVIRVKKATGRIDWFRNGSAVALNVSWASDGATTGGSMKMKNISSSSNACITLQVYNTALSDSDIASLAADPKQIFADPAIELVAQSLSQSNSLSVGDIGIGGQLNAASVFQENSLSSGSITRTQDLSASNLEQVNKLTSGAANPYGRLRSILRDLPLHTWVKVNTSRYVDCQMPVADRPPGHPNSYDHVKIVIPWSSFTFDHARGRLILWGGGHANYTGNQVYQWHADSGEWSLSCLPSKLTTDGNSYVIDKLAPQSSHTYQNSIMLSNNDMFCTFGGAATPGASHTLEPIEGGQRRIGPWLYDLTKTDPEKVGGGDGSGMNPARLGLYAWYPRRDKVPTGTVGTNTYPISYADHVSQAAVSISKNGKDYAIITMDGAASGFPLWYRYEFGDVRLGENDACVYLGRTTQSNLIIREGWMVYDSKREFVYRNGYNKDTNYPLAELVVKNPWTPGIAETAIRLIRSDDSTTFTMNPVSDDCPYGATYDATNDCLWLWAGAFTGSNPDSGAVYRVNIPAYDSSTGWASTTWTVDEIIPAGDRPVGHHQQPVLGKVKHVPEIGAFLILDRAESDGSLDSASVWAFKTEQQQGDLTADNLSQSNSISTGSIAIEISLLAGDITQSNTLGDGLISQAYTLIAGDISQENNVNSGSISKVGELVAAPIEQSNDIATGAVSQTHALVAESLEQTNGISSDEIYVGNVHNLSASELSQTPALSSSAITQVHIIASTQIEQSNAVASAAISLVQTLVVASLVQSNSVSSSAIGVNNEINWHADMLYTIAAEDRSYTIPAV